MKYMRAFTLVELLAVVAIIGLLATLSVGPIRNAQIRNRDAKRKADLNLIAQGLDLYYTENRTYPTGSLAGCESGVAITKTSNVLESGPEDWIPSLNTGRRGSYVASAATKGLPHDPLENKKPSVYHYTYTTCDGTNGYVLEAYLENSKDEEVVSRDGRFVYRVVR